MKLTKTEKLILWAFREKARKRQTRYPETVDMCVSEFPSGIGEGRLDAAAEKGYVRCVTYVVIGNPSENIYRLTSEGVAALELLPSAPDNN